MVAFLTTCFILQKGSTAYFAFSKVCKNCGAWNKNTGILYRNVFNIGTRVTDKNEKVHSWHAPITIYRVWEVGLSSSIIIL